MLSGGERNRLQLAQTLKIGGNLLLLDEPTNDLDVDTLRALEDALLDYAGCEFVFDLPFSRRTATRLHTLTHTVPHTHIFSDPIFFVPVDPKQVWYNLRVSVEAEPYRSRSLYEYGPLCGEFFCKSNLTIY